MVKVVFKEWRKAKNAEPVICVSFISYIVWVRCASGNV